MAFPCSSPAGERNNNRAQRPRKGFRRFLAAAAALFLSGCQTTQVPTNAPLPQDAQGMPVYSGGYALLPMLQNPQGEIIFIMAFSGGGKRSAAFAHGVLRGLKQMPVVENGVRRSLLDEVDYIAAVSGGSFPAMHYGLYHDRSFETFPKEFLKEDVNSYVYGTYLLPWNWEWLANPYYGTNDRMAEVYDRLMFHGATYADLLRQGLPLISVNATDIANGISFSFTQTNFDLICSDLASFPVARAVAASNGFPVLFSPITLISYNERCQAERPPTAAPEKWAETPDQLSRRALLARTANRYLDPERTRYVHLLDGGISDNLALRGVTNGAIALDETSDSFRRLALKARRVLVLSVDGQSATDPALSKQRIVTGLGQIFGAVSGTQIDAYNFETLLLTDNELRQLVESLRKARCTQARVIEGHDCADVRGALVHISLASIPDPQERQRLQAIPTGLTIPDADVDLLVSSGERLVQQNTKIRELISDLDARPTVLSARARR
jgi:NTE family protein